MTEKKTIPGMVAVLVKWWEDGPPAVVLIGTEPTLLKSAKKRHPIRGCIPRGEIGCRVPTETERRQLQDYGLNQKLIASGRVFIASDVIAERFEKEWTASREVLKACGLNDEDIFRIEKSKRRLDAFQPKNREERKAASALKRTIFPDLKGEPGRPAQIENRMEIRAEADALEGTIDEKAKYLAQKYSSRRSYIKRILEDS